MTVLTAADLAGKHSYLATSRPDWRRSMATIRAHGGPWPCPGCGTASVLNYRCSACGRELGGETSTTARSG